MKQLLTLVLPLITLSSCVTVKQNEVGVKRRTGTIEDKVRSSGMYTVGPWSSIIKVPISTINLATNADLPTKEGLTVQSEMSILYRIDRAKIPDLLRNVGENYEEVVISPVFRSVVRDVSARFNAKDLHTAERANIEKTMQADMAKYLEPRGIIVEGVLLKSVKLPKELTMAIEERLRAEQEAFRMQFVLDREKQEAERKKLEAAGIRDAQKIISEGLNPLLIQWRAIEAFKELSKSNNAKVIITDGKSPFLMQADPVVSGKSPAVSQ
ncbi:prohibitin family protein [Phnomibacter ginsenosidimutans]|jgi:regulator of protease activity HflC (stomatin/prohibitin superfamily)|uniref:Prohibitin family protein n=1 Tax=Phnomibacter ginsenosidimutans TaxID=2676868 RepID=A0A6I6G9B7_9BACT|nr:prohibitin family protein [Phnomibacter ginsenosidimutans]QGW29197.1 prohibitin family protein [Phnomibacter ginsenosidimutans]